MRALGVGMLLPTRQDGVENRDKVYYLWRNGLFSNCDLYVSYIPPSGYSEITFQNQGRQWLLTFCVLLKVIFAKKFYAFVITGEFFDDFADQKGKARFTLRWI